MRDAVVAARKAFAGWSGATAYNRGQVLYRVAEMLEGRREQFAAEVQAAEGGWPERRSAQVDEAIDRWVYYAGWADKYAQVAGAHEPGRRAVLHLLAARADRRRRRLRAAGLVAARSGLGARAGADDRQHAWSSRPQARPLPAVSLTEVLATSDVPGGVVNLLTGFTARTRAVARRRTAT